MWTKFMSAWLCAPAGVADEVWVVDGAAEEVASLVAELLHAPGMFPVSEATLF